MKQRSELEAYREAHAMAAQLGSGWIPRVWENLGWYWTVRKGPIEIRPRHGGGYAAEFRCPMDAGGWRNLVQLWVDGDTPWEALHNCLEQGRSMASIFSSQLSAAEAELETIQIQLPVREETEC